MNLSELKQQVLNELQKLKPEILELSRYLIDHPETAYLEKGSAYKISSFLREKGFRIEAPFCDVETAFRADPDVTADFSGKKTAVLAEYDALEGIGHGCGHNFIASAAAAAAIAVKNTLMPDYPELASSFCLFGTPAEEVIDKISGKTLLLEKGAFNNIENALIFHPWTETGVALKDFGYRSFSVNFTGQTAHAAADPWHGSNALDAVVGFYNSIGRMRQQFLPGVKLHCIITEGGKLLNVIPDYSSAEVMIRSSEPEDLEETEKLIRKAAEGSALASNCGFEFIVNSSVNPILFDEKIFGLLEKNMATCGEKLKRMPLWEASSDFGDVSRSIPAVSLLYKTHEAGITWHSTDVVEGSKTPDAEEAMIRAAGYLAMTIIDLIEEKQ